jgi:hypothetical protein
MDSQNNTRAESLYIEDQITDVSSIVDELDRLGNRMRYLLNVSQSILDDGISEIDVIPPTLSRQDEIRSVRFDEVDHFIGFNDDATWLTMHSHSDEVESDVTSNDSSRDSISTVDLVFFPPRVRRNEFPSIHGRGYVYDRGYDSGSDTEVDDWIDPNASPVDGVFFIATRESEDRFMPTFDTREEEDVYLNSFLE